MISCFIITIINSHPIVIIIIGIYYKCIKKVYKNYINLKKKLKRITKFEAGQTDIINEVFYGGPVLRAYSKLNYIFERYIHFSDWNFVLNLNISNLDRWRTLRQTFYTILVQLPIQLIPVNIWFINSCF